jgi:hypothetical protein
MNQAKLEPTPEPPKIHRGFRGFAATDSRTALPAEAPPSSDANTPTSQPAQPPVPELHGFKILPARPAIVPPVTTPSNKPTPAVQPAVAPPVQPPPQDTTHPGTLEEHIGQVTVAPMAAALPDPKIYAKNRKKPIMIGAVIAVLLLVGGAAAKMFLLDPGQAPVAYAARLLSAKTGSFSVLASSSSSDSSALLGEGKISVTGNGVYDVSNAKEEKLQTKLEVKLSNTSLAGEVIVMPKEAYLKVSDGTIFKSLGLDIGPDWYKYPLDETSKTDKCSDQSKSKSGSYLGIQLPKSLPVRNAQRVGLFEKVNGHTTSHFRGEVDFNKLQQIIDDANKQLSADCKIDFKKSDYEDVSVSYNLWTSSKFDRMMLHIADSKDKTAVDITFDSSDYNQPVKIEAPANAKDLSTILGDLSGVGAGTDDGIGAGTQQTARDSQRKSDLRLVKTGLENYYNGSGYYPPGNYAGLAKYLTTGKTKYLATIPNDPQGGAPYEYVPAPAGCGLGRCRSYVLKATLENTKDSQAVNGQAVVNSVEQ